MLKKETIQRLAKLAKIKAEDLETAIKAEAETDVVIDEKVTSYSEDEIGILKTNEYKSGKEKGVEIAVKDAKEKFNLDFAGKTIDGLVEHAKKAALEEAKIKPDQKVAELEDKVKVLQNTVLDYEKKVTDKETEVSAIKINSELYKVIPAHGENGPALAADDIIQLMRGNGYDFKLENGKIVPYKDGKQLQNHLSEPQNHKDVIDGFLKEKKLIASEENVPGGRGGKDSKQITNFTKLSEIKKSFTDQNKSLLGTEFSEAVKKAQAEYAEFDMSS